MSIKKREQETMSARIKPIAVYERDIKEEEDKTVYGAVSQWQNPKPGTYIPAYASTQTLPPGIYMVVVRNDVLMAESLTLNEDDLIDFEDSKTHKIIEEIELFWASEESFKTMGFLHKRAYLLYGQPGSGKTSTINMIAKTVVDMGDIVLYPKTDLRYFIDFIHNLKKIEPNRKIICILEDVDVFVNREEEALLEFLDGGLQVNNVMTIGTTNYPERLDRRIVARPRRFDKVIKIGLPSKEMRRKYLTTKFKNLDVDIEMWAEKTEGFTFASLADLVISVVCLNNDFESSLERLGNMLKATSKAVPNSNEYYGEKSNSVGFRVNGLSSEELDDFSDGHSNTY